MKIIQITIILVVAGLLISCDNEEAPEENQDFQPGRFYKSEKIGFYTDQMNLTEKEAQKFWPVYNDYSQKRDSLWRAQRSFLNKYAEGNMDMDDDEAALTRFLQFEAQKNKMHERYIEKLKSFMSDEKILQLFYTEHQFKHFMLNRIRGRHGIERGRGRGMREGRRRDGNETENTRPMLPHNMITPHCFD
mgnify:CR=1 FL=1